MNRRFASLSVMVISVTLLLAGCFGRSAPTPDPSEMIVRTPRPTFTPTPPAPTATPPPPTAVATVEPADISSGGETPLAVVNDDFVNARRGPSLDADVIRFTSRGEEFEIIGRTEAGDWWQVCCVDGIQAWIVGEFVDALGPVDSVPIVQQVQSPPTATPTTPPAAVVPPTEPPAPPPVEMPVVEEAEVEAAPADTPTPAAPEFPFALVAQEQLPESNNLVRIFAYIYQGDQPLGGYTLRVVHDGVELPVTATSVDSVNFTWPIANPRQRFQNLKVEFSGVQVGGTWQVQLLDGGGAEAGPPATFSLAATDQNRELYVRYEKP